MSFRLTPSNYLCLIYMALCRFERTLSSRSFCSWRNWLLLDYLNLFAYYWYCCRQLLTFFSLSSRYFCAFSCSFLTCSSFYSSIMLFSCVTDYYTFSMSDFMLRLCVLLSTMMLNLRRAHSTVFRFLCFSSSMKLMRFFSARSLSC